MQNIGLKPVGFTGRLAGIIMNLIHARQYRKILKEYIAANSNSYALSVLDAGCGGGQTVKIFSSILNASSHIVGLDHSPDMVTLARKINKKGIAGGMVEIVWGDVNNLPFSDESFDLVTAFDTLNFWGDLNRSADEIWRVLKKNGVFIIVNGYPAEGTRWYDFVKFKNDEAYRKFLSERGFIDISLSINGRTILIQAKK